MHEQPAPYFYIFFTKFYIPRTIAPREGPIVVVGNEFLRRFTMKRATLKKAICLTLFFTLTVGGLCAEELIQAAILLDTSSSMDGLINQAKTQLWKIVNELATAKRNGVSPALEVALAKHRAGYERICQGLRRIYRLLVGALFRRRPV